MGIISHQDGIADPILTRIVEEDKVPWYKKKNLRSLYFLLLPTCMGVEMTSGFDSSIINAVYSLSFHLFLQTSLLGLPGATHRSVAEMLAHRSEL